MPSEIDISEHKRRNNDGGNTARIQTWILSKIKKAYMRIEHIQRYQDINVLFSMYHQCGNKCKVAGKWLLFFNDIT